MQIILNGNTYMLETRSTLHDLINRLKCDYQNIAIAVNYDIIPRSKYLEFWLNPNDHVEIVTAFQGG